MKNQNSISKPTVIIKPPPSVSAIPSSKKEKLSIDKKMDSENNQQQFYDDNNQLTHDFLLNINDASTIAETPSTPLTEKVKRIRLFELCFEINH
jgi:hypothetical protein